MTKQTEKVAHSELVGAVETALHSHAGGDGGLVDKGGEVITDASGLATVTFTTPYASTNYFILLTPEDVGDTATGMFYNKTVNGFSISVEDDGGKAEPNVTVSWATGLYSNP